MKKYSFVLLLLCLLTPLALHAGSPLICHPYNIGSAKTLPAGNWRGVSQTYDRQNLVHDTLALLTPETPVLVRMETIRRAAIYATADMRGWAKNDAYTTEDREIASALLEQLRARAAGATDSARPLALFDLGFMSETLRQTGIDPSLNGYALLMKAAEARPEDADMQFALALAAAYPKRSSEHQRHLAQARAGAQPGTLLATNLASHFPL